MAAKEVDIVVAKFDYKAVDSQELNVQKNEKLTLMDDSQHWWKVMNSQGDVGYVPMNYMKRSKQGLFSSLRNTLGRRKSRTEAPLGIGGTGNSTGGRPSKASSPAIPSNGFSGQAESKTSMESLGYTLPSMLTTKQGSVPPVQPMPPGYQHQLHQSNPTCPALFDSNALQSHSVTIRDAHSSDNATVSHGNSPSVEQTMDHNHSPYPAVDGTDQRRLSQAAAGGSGGATTSTDFMWIANSRKPQSGPLCSSASNATMTVAADLSNLGDGFNSIGSHRQICVARYAYNACNADELTIHRGDLLRVLEKSSDGWWRGAMITEGKPQVTGWFPSNYVTVDMDKPPWGGANGSQPDSLSKTAGTALPAAPVSQQQTSVSRPPQFPQNVFTSSSSYCSVPVPFSTGGTSAPVAGSQKPLDASEVVRLGPLPPYPSEVSLSPQQKQHAPATVPPAFETVLTLYPFTRSQAEELSFDADEVLEVLEKPPDDPNWWRCRNAAGSVGLVPHNYVRVVANPLFTERRSQPLLSSEAACPRSYPVSVSTPQPHHHHHHPLPPMSMPSSEEIRASFAAMSITSSAFSRKPWCWGVISRSDCESMLNNLGSSGEFIIRDSESHPGDLTITMNAGNKNRNFKVHVDNGEFHIGQKVFPSLDALIEHYRTHPIYKNEQEKHFLTRPFQHPNCSHFLRQIPLNSNVGRPLGSGATAQPVFH